MPVPEKVVKILEKNLHKFSQKQTKTTEISVYQTLAGFTESTRLGSRIFDQVFGSLMGNIWLASSTNKMSPSRIADAVSEEAYYQFKNKYNTMKASMAYHEIRPMLERSIVHRKRFFLVVLEDLPLERNRIIPLHEGQSLSKIRTVPGYDPLRHLWMSGDVAYEYFFGDDSKDVKKYIFNYLENSVKPILMKN